jgi:O-antigen ligase
LNRDLFKKRKNSVVEIIGFGGAYLFAVSALLSRSGANIALGAMVLAFILSFRSWWPVLKRDRVFLFSICFFLLLALRTVWAAWDFPQLTDRHLDGFWDWFYLSFFIPTAWWFQGKTKRAYAALYLLFGGLLLHIFYETNWSQLERALHGARSGLGMQIPLTGLFSCTALLGTIMLAPRIWGSAQRMPLFILRVAVWFVFVAAFLEVLLITQSITSWLAGVIVIPPLVWILVRRHFRLMGTKLRAAGAVFAIVGIAAIVFLLIKNAGTIEKRLSSQEKVIQAITTLDFDKIPFTAGIGMRLWTYRYGVGKWLERPFFGWGTGVEVAKLPQRPAKCLDHMHNTYLEILTRFGIVGLFFFIAGIWLFVSSLRKAYHRGRLPLDLLLFFIGALGILIMWCAGNFRMPTYLLCHYILLGGLAYSFCFAPARQEH